MKKSNAKLGHYHSIDDRLKTYVLKIKLFFLMWKKFLQP